MATDYTIYCDESRHDSGTDGFMTIGGIWVPSDQKKEMIKALRNLYTEHNIGAEVKWSKTSQVMLEAYKALIDYYFSAEISFRVIVVDKSKLRHDEFNDGDDELGYYKFYYQMLNKWLSLPGEHSVLLDYKKNKGFDRYRDLENCLKTQLPATSSLKSINIIHSHDSPLAQLSDLLIGATAAKWSGVTQNSAKAQLIQYIELKRGASLTKITNYQDFCKFNLFKINLR